MKQRIFKWAFMKGMNWALSPKRSVPFRRGFWDTISKETYEKYVQLKGKNV